MEQNKTELNGILLMNKPQGFTSHDVVAKLRGILKTRKIGHGGTLDPLATGVLPVFIGGATKAADFAAAQDKTYLASFALGAQTDTQDVTGAVTAHSDVRATRTQVEQAVAAFSSVQSQLPPMYSAIKIGGKKLYDLARAGKEVDRPLREIVIHDIVLTDFSEEMQTGSFSVTCSKGTYVRTLVHDLGVALGTLAHMTALTRTRAGAYPLSECIGFADVEQAMAAGQMPNLLLPVDSLFADLPAVSLDAEGAARALRGAVVFERMVSPALPESGALCRVYEAGRFVMLGKAKTLEIGGKGLFVHKNFR